MLYSNTFLSSVVLHFCTPSPTSHPGSNLPSFPPPPPEYPAPALIPPGIWWSVPTGAPALGPTGFHCPLCQSSLHTHNAPEDGICKQPRNGMLCGGQLREGSLKDHNKNGNRRRWVREQHRLLSKKLVTRIVTNSCARAIT